MLASASMQAHPRLVRELSLRTASTCLGPPNWLSAVRSSISNPWFSQSALSTIIAAAELQLPSQLVYKNHLTGDRSVKKGLSDEKGYDEMYSAQGFFTYTEVPMEDMPHGALLGCALLRRWPRMRPRRCLPVW